MAQPVSSDDLHGQTVDRWDTSAVSTHLPAFLYAPGRAGVHDRLSWLTLCTNRPSSGPLAPHFGLPVKSWLQPQPCVALCDDELITLTLAICRATPHVLVTPPPTFRWSQQGHPRDAGRVDRPEAAGREMGRSAASRRTSDSRGSSSGRDVEQLYLRGGGGSSGWETRQTLPGHGRPPGTTVSSVNSLNGLSPVSPRAPPQLPGVTVRGRIAPPYLAFPVSFRGTCLVRVRPCAKVDMQRR